jgi:predicted nucleic acid-binding protein
VILVDTSVWIDHLRRPDAKLVELLDSGDVLIHPLVRLELTLGLIANREQILANLALLQEAEVADTAELFRLVEARKLYRRGIGVSDLHLLASALMDKTVSIWTRDRRLDQIAEELGVRAPLP